MSLNAKDVSEILKALEASSFDSLDLEVGDVKLSLRRSGAAPAAAATSSVPATTPAAAPARTAAPVPAASPPAAAPVPSGSVAVPAPLLGVFYRAPRPGEPPYVEVGDRVEPDTLIGIIEVMKLMNSVRAGVSGRIVAIPARNGELIEFGEAVLHVHPD